jgi:hypothetical protein
VEETLKILGEEFERLWEDRVSTLKREMMGMILSQIAQHIFLLEFRSEVLIRIRGLPQH